MGLGGSDNDTSRSKWVVCMVHDGVARATFRLVTIEEWSSGRQVHEKSSSPHAVARALDCVARKPVYFNRVRSCNLHWATWCTEAPFSPAPRQTVSSCCLGKSWCAPPACAIAVAAVVLAKRASSS
eukprot:3281551-Rhodomonas_salina.1